MLRTNNGTEYLSKEFDDFFTIKEIVYEKSTPYVHQQNGHAEREMRTLVESARSMLIAKNLPKNLWAEVVKMAAYVLNRIISKQLDDMTAYKKWFKRKPVIKHMQIFGSDTYKNVPKRRERKWTRKAKK